MADADGKSSRLSIAALVVSIFSLAVAVGTWYDRHLAGLLEEQTTHPVVRVEAISINIGSSDFMVDVSVLNDGKTTALLPVLSVFEWCVTDKAGKCLSINEKGPKSLHQALEHTSMPPNTHLVLHLQADASQAEVIRMRDNGLLVFNGSLSYTDPISEEFISRDVCYAVTRLFYYRCDQIQGNFHFKSPL